MKALGLLELLKMRGFDFKLRTKLVRHKPTKQSIEELRELGFLEEYQRFQTKPVFHRCEQIVSFTATSGTRAQFLGVFSVHGHRAARDAKVSNESAFTHVWRKGSRYYYDLHRVKGYEAFEDRLVVEWGKATISWHQHLINKEVVEIRPPGQIHAVFKDYLEFSLSFGELEKLCRNQDGNREWKSRLAAVAGVYLIVHKGQQYVGSAYGADGVWGRWSQYVRTKHGGNVKLKKLLAGNPDAYKDLNFSLLQVLPKSMTMKEVQQREAILKLKLGTRAEGLNGN